MRDTQMLCKTKNKMNNKVALVIIYNHRFDKNIEVLEQIYKNRFNFIYHLVPFYDGDKPNVIPVYENSYYFQGYVAQGLKNYFDNKFNHYFYIGDDVLINPIINEDNYTLHLNLDDETSFLPGFINFHEINGWFWQRSLEAYNYKTTISGVEINTLLPDYDTALKRFKHHNLSIEPLSFDQIMPIRKIPRIYQIRSFYKYFFWQLNRIINKNKKFKLNYPLVGSYSDIFVVSSKSIKQFCHYCGIFSATKLFVEIAIPTSLVLSANKIITEKNLNLQGRALWVTEDFKILERYDYQLKKILNDFPKSYLYLHPIKLSKWKI